MSDYIDNVVQRAVGSEINNMVMPYVTPYFIPRPAIPFNEPISEQEEQIENDTLDFNTTADKKITANDPVNLTKNTIEHPDQTVQKSDKNKDIKEKRSNKPSLKKNIEDTSQLTINKYSTGKIEDNGKLSRDKPSSNSMKDTPRIVINKSITENEETGEQPEAKSRDPIKNITIEKSTPQHKKIKIAKPLGERDSILDQETKKSTSDRPIILEETSTEKEKEAVILEKPATTKYIIEKKPVIQPYILQARKSEKKPEKGKVQSDKAPLNISEETGIISKEKDNTDKGKVTLQHSQKKIKVLHESSIYSVSKQKKSIESEHKSSTTYSKINIRSEKKKHAPIHITIGTIEVNAKKSILPTQSTDVPKVKAEGFGNYTSIRNYRIKT